MSKVRRHKFLDLDDGSAGDDPFARKRRSVIVATIMVTLLGVVSLVIGALLIYSDLAPTLGYAFIAVAFVRFLGVPLSRFGHESAAFLTNVAAGSVLYCAASLEFGPNAGIDIWAPAFVALPPLVADRQHPRVRIAIAAMSFTVVFGTSALMRIYPPGIAVTPQTLLIMRRFNLAAAVLLTATILLIYRRLLDRAELRVQAAQKVSERLLGNILPSAIASRLKRDEYPIADQFQEISVLFADIVGFTEYAAHRPPESVVELLNRVFFAFDDMVERRGLEKIKTIGDAYMAAAGVPDARADHAEAVADLAFEMLDFAASAGVGLRIGIHSGRVVAGVIGKHKFSYDIWGGTVNEAARLQTTSEPGRIQISAETARRLGPGWRLEPRGTVELKGLGEVATYFLLGRADAKPRDAASQISA
ncbi:MAG TPA: adenylate/guanylate cyclase domain-containing protein [Stellaceae bacterium]|nr:adenylate/guanylate cyclase domain-containing protein [Stellaceae bacterium]